MKLFVFLFLTTFAFVFVSTEGDVVSADEEVPLEPLNCPDGEVESDCYGHCQGTCGNPYAACIPLCLRGCVCPEGQVRTEEGGPCVPEDEC